MVHFEAEGVLKKGVREWVAVVFDGETLSLYVDGAIKEVKKTGTLNFSDWERGYPLVIGSEADGKFPWAGRIHSVAIFDRGLNGKEIQSFGDREKQPGHTVNSPLVYYRFADIQGPTVRDHGIEPRADLVVPKYFTPYKRSILKKPSNEIRNLWSYRRDILLNFLCFIPLGFLFVNFLHSQGFPSPYAILLTMAIGFNLSLIIEILQAFLPGRESDLTDLIINTLGTIAGSFLRRTAT
jgi:VanZ family protein